MNEEEYLSKLPTVPLKSVEAAIKAIKEQFPNSEDLHLSFEYLIGSFYPTIYENMRNSLKEAYTRGYAQGISENKI